LGARKGSRWLSSLTHPRLEMHPCGFGHIPLPLHCQAWLWLFYLLLVRFLASCFSFVFPISRFFSHCSHPHANVATIFQLGISSLLDPRLSLVASSELATLNSSLASISLQLDLPDTRLCRSTNKSLSNKDFYLNTFRHLQKDDIGLKIWKSVAPLKCKIFIWLAHRCCLPTNACRF
jgi:hypothetical protein